MADGRNRVVVWSTGGIGSIAIRAIHQRPNLDLVGVWVHSEDKVGRDAGELANGDPIGLAVTDDADALIALRPDCVIYAASGPERDALAIPDYVKLLSAGINVATTSTTRLVNPHAYEPAEWRDQLVVAAKEGQASLYAGDALGFGRPMEYEPWIGFPGAIAGEWQGQIRMVADALGVEIQEIRETFDRAVTERTLEVAMGTVDAGTCGALRMQAIGVVDGHEALGYRVVITGTPDIDCTFDVTLRDRKKAGIEGMTSGAGAMVATAMRVVNAVPYVVAAQPGLLSSVDLPLTVPRDAFS
jgi:2,4-diaminopentanoate dehydrogenase